MESILVWDPRDTVALASLGTALSYRFDRLGELEDLEEAILKWRDAVNHTPDGHPHKPSYLSNLGVSLRCRFNRLGELNDPDDAILK